MPFSAPDTDLDIDEVSGGGGFSAPPEDREPGFAAPAEDLTSQPPLTIGGYDSPFLGRLRSESQFYNSSPAAQLRSQFRYSEQTPDADAQLSRAQRDVSTAPLPTPGTLGQAYTAVTSPPRSFQELAETLHEVEQNNDDTTATLRAMAKRHGLDPDAVAKLPPLWERYLQGAGDAALDTGLSFTSPTGLATLGMGALPKAVQKAASIGFSYQMLSQTPDQVRTLLAELNKPADQQNPRKIASAYLTTIANLGSAGFAGAHGVGPDLPLEATPPRPSESAAEPPNAADLANLQTAMRNGQGDALLKSSTPNDATSDSDLSDGLSDDDSASDGGRPPSLRYGATSPLVPSEPNLAEVPATKLEPSNQTTDAGTTVPPASASDLTPTIDRKTMPDGIPRDQWRNEQIRLLLDSVQPIPPGETPDAILLGGGPGAGKTSVKDAAIRAGEIDSESTVTISADDFTTGEHDVERAGAQGIPEYKALVNSGVREASSIVRKEAGLMVTTALAHAMNERRSMIYDSTMRDYDWGAELIQRMKKAGYKITMVGVAIDPKVALQRAEKRWQDEGRDVPVDDSLRAHAGFAQSFPRYLDLVDEATLWDNNGDEPRLILRKTGNRVEILDQKAYARFINGDYEIK